VAGSLQQRRVLKQAAPNTGHVVAATRHQLNFTVMPGQQWTLAPSAACAHVPEFIWQVLDAGGGSGGRGIDDGCQPIGPLTLAAGNYHMQTADADYQLTVRTS
jgi:hypothetical protein